MRDFWLFLYVEFLGLEGRAEVATSGGDLE